MESLKGCWKITLVIITTVLTTPAWAAFDRGPLEAKKLKVQALLHKLKKNYGFLSEATAPINDLHKDFIKLSESASALIQQINNKLESLDQVDARIAELKIGDAALDPLQDQPKDQLKDQFKDRLQIEEESKAKAEATLKDEQTELNRLDQLLFNLELKLKASPSAITDLSKSVSSFLGGLACRTGFWQKAETPKAVDPNIMAFLKAAQTGDIEKIKTLLNQGTKIDVQDSSGMNALMSAASNRQTATVKLLLERGARLDLADNKNQTVFSLADENSFSEFEETVFPYLDTLNKIKPAYEESLIPLFSKKMSQKFELAQIKKDLKRESVWITGLSGVNETDSAVLLNNSLGAGSASEINRKMSDSGKTVENLDNKNGPTKYDEEQLVQMIAEQLQKSTDQAMSDDELRHLATRYLSAAGALFTSVGYSRGDNTNIDDPHNFQPAQLRWTHLDLGRKRITKYMTYREISNQGVQSIPILGISEINLSSLESSENANLQLLPLSTKGSSYSKMIRLFKNQPPALPFEAE